MALSGTVKIDITESGEFAIMKLSGDIKVNTILQLKKEFQILINEKKNIAIDMENIGMIDSSGISLLINVRNKLKHYNKKFAVYNLSEKTKKFFKEVNLYKVIDVFNTWEEFSKQYIINISNDLYPPEDYDFGDKLFIPKKLQCPVCNNSSLRGFILNKNTQTVSFDKDSITPSYKGKGSNNNLDIHSMQLTICPQCYFSSRHIIYFNDIDKEFDTSLNEKEILSLSKDTQKRADIVKSSKMDSIDKFYPPFYNDESYWAYNMAEESAHTLFRLENKMSTYDMAHYNSLLMRFCHPNEFDEYLRKTYMWYNEIYSNKNSNRFSHLAIIEAYYYIISYLVYNNKTKEAEKYYHEFKELKFTLDEYNLYLKAAQNKIVS